MGRPSRAALCHPDRKHYARGYCAPCYNTRMYNNAIVPIQQAVAVPTCHPEQPHYARGLCRTCYQRDGKNRAEHRQFAKFRKYGITKEAFQIMLSAQGYACAICQERPEANETLFIDHCHKTGAVRGLLCFRCNTGLGVFRDRPEFLATAIDYLESQGKA